jgi:hypothetical protein
MGKVKGPTNTIDNGSLEQEKFEERLIHKGFLYRMAREWTGGRVRQLWTTASSALKEAILMLVLPAFQSHGTPCNRQCGNKGFRLITLYRQSGSLPGRVVSQEPAAL